MPHCRACVDPRRDWIDAQLVAGATLRSLVTATGLSLGGLSRHRAHLKQLLASTLEKRSESENEEHGASLLSRVESLVAEGQDICAKAKAAGKFAAASNALNSVARSLELIGKLSGELQGVNTPGLHLHLNKTTINVSTYDDDVELASLISEATDNFNPNKIAELKQLAEKQSCAITVLPPSQRI
jgi:hypothetical protein